MKINLPVRFKNPWFWIGLAGTILSAMGVSPEMFTSWGAVWEAVCSLFSNPFQIGCVVLAVLAFSLTPPLLVSLTASGPCLTSPPSRSDLY